MAVLLLGDGSELKSGTIEGALLELAFKLQDAESNSPETPKPDRMRLTIDTDNKVANISLSLPITYSFNTSGSPVIGAGEYV